MSIFLTVLVFLLFWIVSTITAIAGAISLAAAVEANDDFVFISLVFQTLLSVISIVSFIIAYLKAKSRRLFDRTAASLIILAVVINVLLSMAPIVATKSTMTISAMVAFVVVFSFPRVIPGIGLIVLQWQLIGRLWAACNGQPVRSLWPWTVTILTGVAICSPPGAQMIHNAIFADPVLTGNAAQVYAYGAVAVIAVLFAIEWWVRRRAVTLSA